MASHEFVESHEMFIFTVLCDIISGSEFFI